MEGMRVTGEVVETGIESPPDEEKDERC